MGQVTVTLNGRTYRLRCGDGEEPRLLQLAGYLEQRIDGLAAEFGQDQRLLLMAALLMADELWEMRERLQDVDGAAEELHPSDPARASKAIAL